MVSTRAKEQSRSALAMYGELCAMICGTQLMLEWSAILLDTQMVYKHYNIQLKH